MNREQKRLHNRALAATKQLQALAGTSADGYWGDSSQDALLASNLRIDINWDKLRFHFGRFSQSQVDGFLSVIAAINKYGNMATKPAFVAYMLATDWHETAQTMQPIAEIGKGRTRSYGKWYKNSDGLIYGHANHYGHAYLQVKYPHLYYGRGNVQLTWWDNYKKLGELLGVDLVNNPDLAMQPDIAAAIMIEGMLGGLFTGLSLERCITYGLYFEFIKARKIINGVDRDDLIAKYAVNFLDSLTLSSEAA